ncbi:MAG: hypothetical protein IAE79_27765 [Anaerolinea sp.]|nr:hypothetical protein [Anaerolinea sp.]
MTLPDVLALINDVLQAVIVIFGSAVVLYNVGRGFRSQITSAFSALITFVVIAYLTELLVSRAIISNSAETWLRLEWVGIAMVPATQYHLSDALLSMTGAPPQRRKHFVVVGYVISIAFLFLVLWTNLVAGHVVQLAQTFHLLAGPLFPLFTFYFWSVSITSIYNVWRARQRCITSTTRRRMTTTFLAFMAAPLAVFPYLVTSGDARQDVPFILWPVLIIGNLVVGIMFALLTSNLIYFDAASPDRVVRVRLYKYMARVPLAGTIVLLVYVLVNRSSRLLGLPAETALGFTLVATVMLVEWAVHVFKRPLERLFQLNDDPDVRRIQELGERILTTGDLHQLLESILAATCEALRTPTAFVAAITRDGPQLEAVVGPLTEPEAIWHEADWYALTPPEAENDTTAAQLQTMGTFIVWQNFWIRPLYSRKGDVVLGILGIWARAAVPDLNADEQAMLEKLIAQASEALEDRILQQEVFRAVEGLLPGVTALQERRRAATFGGLPVLTGADGPTPALLADAEEFSNLVRDALTHYWGGPKLTQSPLLRLQIVQRAMTEHDTPANALRAILASAIELQKPEGERNLTRAEWLLYNILELKFIQGGRVRDVARRLAMSESDLYRKQRVAIENVAHTIANLEKEALESSPEEANPEEPAVIHREAMTSL